MKRYVEMTFRATPCNEPHEQLFTAWYEVEDYPGGEIRRLMPGSLRKLTRLMVVAEQSATEVHDVADQAVALAAAAV